MAASKSEFFDKMVDAARDVLLEGSGATPVKILDRIYGEDGWLPGSDGLVRIDLIAGALRRRFGDAMSTTPVTEPYFSQYGEAPEGAAEVRECVAWGRGKVKFGLVLKNGSPVTLAHEKTRAKLQAGGLGVQIADLKRLADMHDVQPEDLALIIYEWEKAVPGITDALIEDDDAQSPPALPSPDPQKPR